ncbi:argonaute-like protein [Mycena vulgaris]|nr:argonaute-like protein [Mycena vulgaris]
MAGTNVSVITNSFAIKSLPTKTYYQYDIFEAGEKQPPPMKRQRLIHALQTTAAPQIFQPRAVYDGGRLLYASHLIPNGIYRVHGSNQNAAHDARGWYDIQITRTAGKEVLPAHVNQLVVQGHPTSQSLSQTTPATNLLQLLLCQAANLINPNNGKAYFSAENKMQIQGMAVELWRGYFQAIRPTIGRLLVTVDTTVAAMYQSGPLIEVAMAALEGAREVRKLALRDPRSEDFKKLERHFKNRLITVEPSKRIKTIRGLVPGPVGRYEFSSKGDGPVTTVGAHYVGAHNIHLQYPDTIGVVTSGKSAPFKVVIPLELCTMLPGQLYKKKLPPHATATVVSFAAMRPADRLRTIKTGTSSNTGASQRSPILEYENSEFMIEAGMRVDPNPITVPGRLLKVPSLLYNQSRRVEPRDGAWNVLGSRLYAPKKLLRWGVANFDPHRISPQTLQNTIRGILDCCSNLGMDVAPPQPEAVRTGNGHNVKPTIAHICRVLGDPNEIDLIVVLLPSKADDIRTLVKFTCDIEFGVRSQCLREQKLQRANSQYFNNVVLKINARLGGANALVDSPALKEIASKPFIIMGADVAHPGPGTNRPSVVSLVWSHDMHGAAYCATTRVQAPRVELIFDLKDLVKIALEMFGSKHKVTPASVYFYRDGVSEGEFVKVQESEITAITAAFDEVWHERGLKSPKPKLTFVVVGKRHHVSFFPPTANDSVGDKTGNCRAGLVVDKGLANPQFPDFYLQSHAAIKGTSRSGHYIVLQDENFGGNIAKIQELSFALCHIYAKATRSVSIPAPVYYADLACARGKFHIDPASDMDLDGSTSTGDNEAFDLERWKAAYRRINNQVQGSMYFL